MIQVYPNTVSCVPESDREEYLIAEFTKVQFAEWQKEHEHDIQDFTLVDLEHQHVPVATLVPSRDFISVYTRPVETSVPVAVFRNRPGGWKLQRVTEWYQRKHYQVVVN